MHRVRGLEDDGRQRDARRLRVVVLVRDHAEQVDLADAGDVARRADGRVDHLAEERDAQANRKPEHARSRAS